MLTDILLGGASRMVFYGKLGSSSNTTTFKTESELSYKAVKLNSGTTNKTNTLNTHKDMEILVWVIGGNKALDSEKLSFNPFEGTINNLSFSYTDWLNSVTKSTEQIIGIGNPNTRIYPLSEFIFDNPQKKLEVENALIAYAEEKKTVLTNNKTIDYQSLEIKDATTNLFYGKLKINGIDITGILRSNVAYKWTFFPEGNLYRIKGADGYLTREKDYNVISGYKNTPEQLWEIESNTNNAQRPYRIKDPQSNFALTSCVFVYKIPKPLNKTLNIPQTKQELWNPYNSEQFWSIK